MSGIPGNLDGRVDALGHRQDRVEELAGEMEAHSDGGSGGGGGGAQPVVIGLHTGLHTHKGHLLHHFLHSCHFRHSVLPDSL